jgi:nicotinic acid phosphoribosyltransferase
MQFRKNIKAEPNAFQTFWETENYLPSKKVLIVTTDTYFMKNHTYSFDYNQLYQASKFDNEIKAPIVIQMPHMRLNPRVSFESTL